MSIRKQCELLCLNRSSFYYEGVSGDERGLLLMRLIDEEYTKHPFYGTRRMMHWLRNQGHWVNRKIVQRLYRTMGLEGIAPKQSLSKKHPEHKIFPYLLRGLPIVRPNQVFSTDVTYIRLSKGFVYLMAVIDWFSRYVLDFEVSISLDSDFCVDTVNRVLTKTRCDIFNTDQGSQFTAKAFTNLLLMHKVKISMDGKGRALDNIFIERLWRSVKYECVYPMHFTTVREAKQHLKDYFEFYNHERLHQSLGYKTPAQIYFSQ